jgi:hypothetical protein
MRVTTEKPRRLYGTTADGENTHCLAANCKGRFATQEAAEAVIARVTRVRETHAHNHAVLTAARIRAERDERDAIEAVLEGCDPTPPSSPVQIVNRAQAMGADRCRALTRS